MANLENIKLGDSVIFSSGGWGRRTIIAKVTRVMPKQFEVGSYRFRKKDGAMIGDTYNQCRLATEKDISDLDGTTPQFVKKYNFPILQVSRQNKLIVG